MTSESEFPDIDRGVIECREYHASLIDTWTRYMEVESNGTSVAFIMFRHIFYHWNMEHNGVSIDRQDNREFFHIHIYLIFCIVFRNLKWKIYFLLRFIGTDIVHLHLDLLFLALFELSTG